MLIAGGKDINIYLMYFASGLSGVSMAAGTLIPNLLSLDVYKASGYQEKYGIITAVGTFISAIGFAIIGYTFDFTGSYNLSFAISTGTVVIFFFASFILHRIVRGSQGGTPSPVFSTQTEPAG